MVAMSFESARRKAGDFNVLMAGVCTLVAFGGFLPTYWLQLPAGTFVGPPLLHVHGLLFSAWPLLLLSQTWLAANGRLNRHRAWGLVGISLATAMVVVGLVVAIDQLTTGLAAGYGDRSRAFFLLPMSSLALFAGFFIAAIANIKRPEAHKRLMLLATFALLSAAVARVFFVLITGGGPGMRPGLMPPPSLSIAVVPGLIVQLLIVAGIVRDLRVRGRPHPAWLIGMALTAAVNLLRLPVSGTHAWLAVADAFAHLAR